jgi:hypothetical protein
MHNASLVLVQGLFSSRAGNASGGISSAQSHRTEAFGEYGHALGVRCYEWVDGQGRVLANRLLRLARGTAPAVDAVEIIELDAARFRASLDTEAGREGWQKVASCEPSGFDASRSFILIGAPIQLLEGSAQGQRVLWFGCGLSTLDEAEFVAHYTGHHGPLVAGYAAELGLKRYRQVPGEESELCHALRELGLGKATAPSVFAELFMGLPPLDFTGLRARRSVTRKIKQDEKRHIDFRRSMLLLA